MGHEPRHRIGRRAILATVGGLGAPPLMRSAQATPPPDFATQWTTFKSRFLTADGRIVDTGNKGISHTEGQGYGMLFACHAGDRAGFHHLWSWTERTLSLAGSALHAWKYMPDAPVPVPSLTSATDAELMLALALARAGGQWNERRYTQAAGRIFKDIRLLLTVQLNGRNLLLPGQDGFLSADAAVINPSYYLFPALAMAAQLDNAAQWQRIAADGTVFLSDCRFGEWGLPADWVSVSQTAWTLAPAPGHSPRFSYDAIRVPLYLLWGAKLAEVGGTRFQAYWRHFAPHIPSWIDLETNARSATDGPAGFRAIAQMTGLSGAGLPQPDSLPLFGAADDYYSAALCLLSRMVCEELRDHQTSSEQGQP